MTRALIAAGGVALAACASQPAIDLGPRPNGVSVDTRMDFYDVNAGSLMELRRDLVLEGPQLQGRRWMAVTRWNFHWSWQYDSRGLGCELRNPHVQMQATIEFPRWKPSAEPDSVTLDWWQAMNRGLAEHERGHAQLAMKTAGEIVRALDGMRGVACDALGVQANRVAGQLVEEGKRRQSDYDGDTRHGATQIQAVRRLREP